ncbi:OLC1v1019167C4 [Oldenlandia corymbosa var. corymbosa]|nr:OLC1v1019167C4 [Oldenlandia corymbosa var. corymbosa]
MSARLLKKVLQEQEATEQEQQRLGHSEDESDSPASSAPARNPFDLLGDDDENDDHQNLSEEDDLGNAEEPGCKNVDGIVRPSEKASVKPVSSSNSKSKKKKKKKTKEKLPTNPEDLAESDEMTLENLSIEEVSSKHEHAASSSKLAKLSNSNKGSLGKKLKSSILQVDPKFLIAENELRRIFGSKVVKSFERGQHSGNSRHSIAGRRAGSHSHRKTILVSASEHWPRWDGSFSMELLESSKGVNYFRYVHSPAYSQSQRAFEAAKAIHDLNGVTSILLHHPYHIDSLITIAEYFKFSGEHQMAADAIAKCLYALECAWHPMFSPLQGNCQLKHSHDTNKPLFTTLFTHMKNMDRRGCHRSALEICKLLLSLDSDDPVGALFCIDYYALRAEEHLWLEQFSEEYESENSLWLFPNFSYSLAICRYYLEQKEHTENTEKRSEKASSEDLMKQALMLHPSVLKKLVAKVPLKDQAWTRILENSYFRSEQSGSPSLDHLINLYVERSYLIWRLPELQKLLRDSAHAVIANLKDNKNDAKDWTCVRKEAFSSGKNEYSHLMLSDFSDSVPTLPPEVLQNFMVDPGMRGGQENEGQVMAQPAPVRVPRDLTNRNPIVVLLESLLPWADYGEGGAEHAQNDNNDQAH